MKDKIINFLKNTKPVLLYIFLVNGIALLDLALRTSEISILSTIFGNLVIVIFFYGIYFLSPILLKIIGSIFSLFTIALFYTTTIIGYNIQKHMIFILLFQTSRRELNMFLEMRNILSFFFVLIILLSLSFIKGKKLSLWMTPKTRIRISTLLLILAIIAYPCINWFAELKSLEKPMPFSATFKEHGSLKSMLMYPFLKTKNFVDDLNYQKKPLQIYLMVGETARADHLTINGYPKLTTPFLSSEADLVNFGTTKSCANATYLSWKYMFSHVSCDTSFLAIDELPIPYYFNQQNINTLIVGQTNEKSFIPVLENSKVKEGIYKYKNNMYQAFQLFSNKQATNQFFILNSQGSHMLYDHYDESVIKSFLPICKNPNKSYSGILNCPINEVINKYDNTILYLDWQIGHIIKELKNSDIPAIILYISDHGEELGEHKGFFGHIKSSIENYMVPFFVYTNKAFQTQYPNQYKTLLYNAKQYKDQMAQDVIWNSIMDIAGFTNKDGKNIIDYKRSIFSSQLLPRVKKNWFKVDYNRN